VGTRLRVGGVVAALPDELAEAGLIGLQEPVSGVGIFVLLPPGSMQLARGALVEVDGLLTLRRQTLTLIATAQPRIVGAAELEPPLSVQRPAAGAWAWEEWEGRRVSVSGTIAGSPQVLADGAISLRLRLGSGEELNLGLSRSVAATLSLQLRESGRFVIAQGLMHQRGSTNGGGYRLWLEPVAGLVPHPVSPPTPDQGGEASPGTASPATGGGLARPELPLGVPTIAIPTHPGKGWFTEIVTALQVHEGRLELWLGGVIRLVVLPPCETPVDHEGVAPYPNPR
jgi:hypothetical protein